MIKAFLIATTGASPATIGLTNHGNTSAVLATMLIGGLIYAALRKMQMSRA
jgi:hypothetical protein